MGKVKISVNKRALQYSSNGIVAEDEELICASCGIRLENNKFLIDQHLKTEKHVKNFGLRSKLEMLPGMKIQNEFAKDICQTFVACNIPLYALKRPSMRSFIEKYTGRRLPDESTIRKNYLDGIYEETIENIRLSIGEHSIWASVDETSDAQGRYIANVVVGALRPNAPSHSFLIHSARLERTDSQTIAYTLNDAFQLLWPNGIKHEKVFLLVTDSAPYMLQAAGDLQESYPRMLHVTCLARALHRVADFIRSQFTKLDNLVDACETIFLSSPYCVQKLKTLFPDLALPPSPVIRRWGTWLSAVKYYADEWNRIRDVVNSLDDDSASIEQAKELFADEDVFVQIGFVNKHYVFLANCITELEASGLPMNSVLQIIKKVLQKVTVTPDVKVKEKLSEVLHQNPGLTAISALNSNDVNKLKIYEPLKDATPFDVCCYTYAPLVSVDVERSSSRYKSIIADKGRSFVFSNLRNHLIIEFNSHKFENIEENDESKFKIEF